MKRHAAVTGGHMAWFFTRMMCVIDKTAIGHLHPDGEVEVPGKAEELPNLLRHSKAEGTMTAIVRGGTGIGMCLQVKGIDRVAEVLIGIAILIRDAKVFQRLRVFRIIMIPNGITLLGVFYTKN